MACQFCNMRDAYYKLYPDGGRINLDELAYDIVRGHPNLVKNIIKYYKHKHEDECPICKGFGTVPNDVDGHSDEDDCEACNGTGVQYRGKEVKP